MKRLRFVHQRRADANAVIFRFDKDGPHFIAEQGDEADDTAVPTDTAVLLATIYSTVTLFARLRGWSTSQPRRTAVW